MLAIEYLHRRVELEVLFFWSDVCVVFMLSAQPLQRRGKTGTIPVMTLRTLQPA